MRNSGIAAQANPANSGCLLGDEFDMQYSPEDGYARMKQMPSVAPRRRPSSLSANFGKE